MGAGWCGTLIANIILHVPQAKGEPGQAPVPIPPLKQANKYKYTHTYDSKYLYATHIYQYLSI